MATKYLYQTILDLVWSPFSLYLRCYGVFHVRIEALKVWYDITFLEYIIHLIIF